MTYVAAIIGDNPQNYWRLNEGAGATATLDYGNSPGMLWPSWVNNNGFPIPGRSGFGYGGVTADGGAMDVGGFGVWNLTQASVSSSNPYTPIPDPGTLEFWYFDDSASAGGYVGWVIPGVVAGGGIWGVSFQASVLTVSNFTTTPILVPVSPLSQWHHVAMSWSGSTAFVYLDGAQAQPFTYSGPIGGQHVHFCIGLQGTAGGGLNDGGLVTEAATYRRGLTVAELAAHFGQAELKGQRPHWIGQRQVASSSTAPPVASYTLGVTHSGLSGSGTIGVPTGLRGLKVDITTPPAGQPVLPGVPPYLINVGWLSCLDGNGMLHEIRPNRDTQTWLPDNFALVTTVGYALEPGVVLDLTELDPA